MLLTALLAAIVSAAMLVASPALAAPDTVYCLNGVSTTLPATIVASSTTQGSSSTTWSEAEALDNIANAGGVFTFGFAPGLGGGIWVKLQNLSNPSSVYEAGYSTNQIALGVCKGAPGVTHVGVCKLLDRADGTKGLFQHITVADWNDADGPYFDAPAASWVEGLGLTCDDPVALGYKPTGTKVAWGGTPDPNHDARGVRGSGFNDIYPLFSAP
jgi:hypothetical protein